MKDVKGSGIIPGEMIIVLTLVSILAISMAASGVNMINKANGKGTERYVVTERIHSAEFIPAHNESGISYGAWFLFGIPMTNNNWVEDKYMGVVEKVYNSGQNYSDEREITKEQYDNFIKENEPVTDDVIEEEKIEITKEEYEELLKNKTKDE